ncbi:glycosyltransferase family protein [Celeribacter litoreus]|uniref:hypothetical protein n=1 Tax=Celeribacter litoreus TaxID=2876714 RepID=UPI001CCC2DC0|nr:hypothetical protein [Celeribacter litoreus]MCA0042069.1 hypothetical protein [Celeribacter litoreus]
MSALRKAKWWVRYLITGRRDGHPSEMSLKGASSGAHYLSGFWVDLASREGFHTLQSPATLSKRRKVALIGDLNLPQCRKYRVEQLSELFEQMGMSYEYSHYEDLPRSAAILQNATHLMLYRSRMDDKTAAHLYEARRLSLPILYDIDDPLFSVAAYATYGNMKGADASLAQHFLNEAPLYAAAMNMADMVSLSTPALAEEAARHTGRPTVRRRNFADQVTLRDGARAMASVESGGDASFRLVFASGSDGHEEDFELIRADVIDFLEGDPRRRLRILGRFDPTRLPQDLSAQIERFAFLDYSEYLKKLAECDLALMPLTDDRFNACKSAVRVMDAASVGVPSVVGHVGDLGNIVRNEETGYALSKGSSWKEVLEDGFVNRRRTREMGQSARKILERDWSARADMPITDAEFLEFFR